ncbi:M56 family metallopeptidase [Flavobacterium rivuli]|uniref:M56 family metallopeptidase n=1 Tax=Flavobacterium rivuli TaxID=498301 RepID=UPI00035D865E|nr:M56 family metallopeptidase [Flavobacterium rivuli]
METFIIYLIKASGLTVLFFLAYTVLLKKETFFTPNRMFLLAGLFTSALLPLMVYTKVIWVTPQPALQMAVQQIDIDSLMANVPSVATPRPFTINWFYVAGIAYVAGFLLFAIHFLIDLYKVKKMLRGKKVLQQENFKYIDSEAIKSPFSFFKYIVYNSASLQPQELNNIIAHEKVHSSQNHSLDVLLSQLFCIVFWFNPFAWLYKKAISQNLEFIADSVAAKQVIDVKAYQITLLKITVQQERLAITNHFYQSLIKKRIVMLNKQQSKKRNFYKYALIVPALVAFVLLYQVEILAREKQQAEKKTTSSVKSFSELRVIMDVTSTATDKELKDDVAIFKQEFDADVTFTNIKRNTKGEITAIKVIVKDKDNQVSYPVHEVSNSGQSPISSFTVDISKDDKTGKNIINFGQPKTKLIKISIPGNLKDTIVYGKDATTQIISNSNHKNIVHDPEEQANYLYIIDGVPRESDGKPLSDIDPNTIDKIEVIKNQANNVKLYGERAKNGVILITTKKNTNNSTFKKPEGTIPDKWFQSAPDPLDMNISDKVNRSNSGPFREVTTYVYTESANYKPNSDEDNLKNILESDKIDYKKAYIRINGKDATAAELERLKPKKIETTVIIPGNVQVISKYGEKAANGVIIVELKGFKSEIYADTKNDSAPDAEQANIGYIIDKNNDKKAIEFYIKELKKRGLKITVKTLERNEKGLITSIEIELVDKKTGKIQLASYTNKNSGIPDVYVGFKGGAPALYSMGK